MAANKSRNLILLGVGKLALAVAEQLNSISTRQANLDCTIFGTTRSIDRMEFLIERSIKPLLIDVLLENLSLLSASVEDADVLVSFPPDHALELQLANVCANAHRIIYISSTGVYGSQSGVIDDSTFFDSISAAAQKRLESERIWRSAGAIVLRSPAIYGKDRGLHLTLPEGTYKPPANSQNFVSRIHQTDFARIILLSFDHLEPLETFLVGDMEPARHCDVVSWLCSQMGIEQKLIVSSSPSQVFEGNSNLQGVRTSGASLRGDRQVNASKLLERLNYDLCFPTFRDGYSAILADL